MAIWQFDMNLLPASSFEGLPLDGSVFCKPLFATTITQNISEEEFENYWVNSSPFQYKSKLATLFGKEKENWGDGFAYGSKDNIFVEIWDDTFSIRIHMKSFETDMCDKVVTFAKKNRLVVVFNETGLLHAPDVEVMLENIKKSRAYRFVRSPNDVIIEAAELFNE